MQRYHFGMPPAPRHCDWFEDTETLLTTADGRDVRVFRFNHQDNPDVMNAWAAHFREHYCSDADLTALSAATGMSRGDYLRDIKFPSTTAPGPSVRSGDFSEILVADYIQYLLGYTVPRTRYDRKDTRDSSTKSVDVLGFRFNDPENPGPGDELITCEVKGSLTAPASNTLADAIDGSKKDHELRLPFALTAALLRLKDRGDAAGATALERFMNKTAFPYREVSSAALVCSNAGWNEALATDSNTPHPNTNLMLVVFLGDDLMVLANRLYELAYATA